MTVIYQAPGVVTTTYDPASTVILVSWEHLAPAHIRPCLERQMEQVKAGARFLVVDVGTARGAPTPEHQAWFDEEVFPFYRRHGLRALITVVPQSGVTRLGAQRWMSAASRHGFDAWDASDLEAVLELIQRRYGVTVAPGALGSGPTAPATTRPADRG
jgi:hypothetical protein